MNIFAVIILSAILLQFVLSLLADLLNLKALKLEPPPQLKDIYKPEVYRRSQEYLRTNTRFGFITGAFNLAVLLAFWFTGGFNLLDHCIRGWGLGNIISGLLYVGILMLAYGLINLPFSLYDTFVIEERFGFNRTVPRVFIMDRLKGLALAVVLGAPLIVCVLALFEYAGVYAWLYCWAAVTIYMLVVQLIAPTWIMPLFNKFTPMEQGELRKSIISYADSVNFPVQNIFVMDGSKRSSKSNAFFTGFGRNKRIALYDTLIAQHSVGELVAVLAHEIGHYRKKHILQGVLLSILHFGLVFFLMSIFLNSSGLYSAFYMDSPSIYSGLIFFGLLYTPVELILSILLNLFSRKNESEADRFAASTINVPAHLADALKKLASNNLSDLTPHPFYVFLYYSHPPLLHRINAIEMYKNNTE